VVAEITGLIFVVCRTQSLMSVVHLLWPAPFQVHWEPYWNPWKRLCMEYTCFLLNIILYMRNLLYP